MKHIILILFMIFAAAFKIYGADEKVDIIIENDEVKVLNTDVYANCCSIYMNEIYISGYNITITQRDTSAQKCKCMCVFDLTTILSNLTPGNYNLTLYREELEKYGYYDYHKYTIANKKFTVDELTKMPMSHKFNQSPCKVTNIDDKPFGQLTKDIEVYPNPASSKLTIRFELKDNADITLKLLNLLGKEVQTSKIYARAGIQTLSFEEDIPPGMYIGKIITSNGQYYSFKVVWSR